MTVQAPAPADDDAWLQAGWSAFLRSLRAGATLLDIAECGRIVAPLVAQARAQTTPLGTFTVQIPPDLAMPALPEDIQLRQATLGDAAQEQRFDALAGHALLGPAEPGRWSMLTGLLHPGAELQLFVPAAGGGEVMRAQAMASHVAAIDQAGVLAAVRTFLQADGRDAALAQQLALDLRDRLGRLRALADGGSALAGAVLQSCIGLVQARQRGADPALAGQVDALVAQLDTLTRIAARLPSRAAKASDIAGLLQAARDAGLDRVEAVAARDATGHIGGWWLLAHWPEASAAR